MVQTLLTNFLKWRFQLSPTQFATQHCCALLTTVSPLTCSAQEERKARMRVGATVVVLSQWPTLNQEFTLLSELSALVLDAAGRGCMECMQISPSSELGLTKPLQLKEEPLSALRSLANVTSPISDRLSLSMYNL